MSGEIMAQVLFDDVELQNGKEINRQFFESRCDSAALFELTDAALHHTSATVALVTGERTGLCTGTPRRLWNELCPEVVDGGFQAAFFLSPSTN